MTNLVKRKKVYVFISNVTKALEHEWFVEHAQATEFEFKYVLFNSKDSHLYNFIASKNIDCRNFQLRSKFQVLLYAIRFGFELFFVRPKLVHCHLFEASLIGLVAAKLAGIKKRISTRHHSDFHHLYHPQTVKYDLFINFLSTNIIAVSDQIKTILIEREQVPEKKITTILHGIPLKIMDEIVEQRRLDAIKEKYAYTSANPVIGVISRFVEWKGVQYIIPAFKEYLALQPNAILVLANASGNYSKEIQKQLESIPAKSYITIGFENDGQALMKSFDVFVHTPVDSNSEAFGQVYIEAMYLKVPMICTISGIANKLIKHSFNALVVDYRDSKSIVEQLKVLLSNSQLQESITKNAAASVRQLSFENKFIKTITLYR